jgi:argininosuccinate synthase
MAKRLVLAYSGGLDTSVAIHWLTAKGYEVIATTIDVGEAKDTAALMKRAVAAGAVDVRVVDLKEQFATEFLWPALQANALYQGRYPLATALARPLLAKALCEVADETGAQAIAHGSTGKGNDQVRFDVAIATLRPGTEIVAPAREWGLTRADEIQYAAAHGIPVQATLDAPFSVDANLWGRSVEGGVLEDPWNAPPEECYEWTANPDTAEAKEVMVAFEAGVPVAIDGLQLAPVPLIAEAQAIAGAAGVGRIDLMEDRLVGIKSREIYEAPAASLLIAAHQELEFLTLPRELVQHKTGIEQAFAQTVYNGLWFTPLREALEAYISSTQKAVTGEVKLGLAHGKVTVLGRKSPQAIYSHDLATYGAGDLFDHKAAVGFIALYGLQSQAYAKAQAAKAHA